jgi:precorrin-6B methylase 2
MAEDTQRFSDGTAYEQFMGRWTRAIGTIFLDWLAPPANARWLDIGCGTGALPIL